MDDSDLRTTVTDDGTLEVPASLREEIGLEPGDTVQWDVTDSGRLLVDVVDVEE